ncbi:beta strand repeat-containing protein [Rhodovulum sp. DZ06]|uniref:beta strand repeat-containing protein n=1 Tax=Rhodovulum sp. DZ06 TaxID=3425126 RepID=UPI003D3416C4
MTDYFVTTEADIVNAADGLLSLREAVAQAEADGTASRIFFDSGVSNLAVSGQIGITEDLEIYGANAAGAVTLTGGGANRFFTINGATVDIHDARLTGGSETSGGAINAFNAELTLQNVTLSANEASQWGGAINASASAVTLVDVYASDNDAGSEGGAVRMDGGTLEVSGGALDGNTAQAGGALALVGADSTLFDALLTWNEANAGGGLYLVGGTLDLDGTRIRNNHAFSDGGGLYANDADILMHDGSRLHGNSSDLYGGGAELIQSTLLLLDQSSINANSAETGGGVYAVLSSIETDFSGGFTGNTADWGGGLSLFHSDLFASHWSPDFQPLISGNSATYSGGGVLAGGTSSVEGMWFESNTAGDLGGGINATGQTLLRDLTLANNTAGSGGGIAVSGFGRADLVDVALWDNSAAEGGGAWFDSAATSASTLTNVIAQGNAADLGGGLWFGNGQLADLAHVSVGGNSAAIDGGGILATGGGAVGIANSIVAGNVAGALGDDIRDWAGTSPVSLLGANLLGEADDFGGALTPGATVLADAGLDWRAVWGTADPDGGPGVFLDPVALRLTMPLVNSGANPAVGGADLGFTPADAFDLDGDGDEAEPLPTDIAGGLRDPLSGDIGAASTGVGPLEAASLVVTIANDIVDATDGETSLREAVAAVQSGALSGTITFAGGAGETFENGGEVRFWGQPLTLGAAAGGGPVVIDGDANGDGIGDVTIDGRVFATGTAELIQLDLKGGLTVAAGGDVLLRDSVVRGGDARLSLFGPLDGPAAGGGFLVEDGGALTLLRSTVRDNTGGLGAGGAVEAGGSLLSVGSTIEGNEAIATGGAVPTSGDGGGLWVAGDATLISTTVAGNTASSNGGGIAAVGDARLALLSSTVAFNDAWDGHGIHLDLSAGSDGIVVADSIVAGNGIASFDDDIFTTGAGDVVVTGGGAIFGRAIFDDSLAAFPKTIAPVLETTPGHSAPVVTVLEDAGLDIADIFVQRDGAWLAQHRGPVETIALNLSAANPALDAGLPPPGWFPPGDHPFADAANPWGVTLEFSANDWFRATDFLDPFSEDAPLSDFGAYEAPRFVVDDVMMLSVSMEGVAYALGFGAQAGVAYGDAAHFANAVIEGFGADDLVRFTGAEVAQFTRTATGFAHDEDGDGTPETFFDVATAANAELVLAQTAGGVELTAEARPVIGEVMRVTATAYWQTIDFANTYENAVVLAVSPGLGQDVYAVTRLRDVGPDGAQIRLQQEERTYLRLEPVPHFPEQVTLLVLEAGVHQLADGTILHAGVANTSQVAERGFETVHFDLPDGALPAVFAQVQSFNGPAVVNARLNDVGWNSFGVALQEDESSDLYHAAEDVGWLAIEQGSGDWSGLDYEAGQAWLAADGIVRAQSFDSAFAAAPENVMAQATSAFDMEHIGARVGGIRADGFDVRLVEDKAVNYEQSHAFEHLNWLAFSGSGTLEGRSMQKVYEAGTAVVDHTGFHVEFASAFVNPVVIVQVETPLGVDLVIGRVSDVDAHGFDVRLQELDSSDGYHAPHAVSWIAVEAGAWLVDGMVMQAGLDATEGDGIANWDYQGELADVFEGRPAVFAQTQTENDPSFLASWARPAWPNYVGLEIEGDAHGAETMGWLAVETGVERTEDGAMQSEAGVIRSDGMWERQAFSGAFDDAPLVFVERGSGENAYDRTVTPIQPVDAAGFAHRLQVSATTDEEIPATPEQDLSWFALAEEGEGWGYAIG